MNPFYLVSLIVDSTRIRDPKKIKILDGFQDYLRIISIVVAVGRSIILGIVCFGTLFGTNKNFSRENGINFTNYQYHIQCGKINFGLIYFFSQIFPVVIKIKMI